MDAYNGDPEHDEAIRNANYDIKTSKVAKSNYIVSGKTANSINMMGGSQPISATPE
jgi:hypothetical protein